jgi:hypothetical protein
MSFDAARTWAFVKRLARTDDTAFREIADDEGQTAAALALPAVVMLAGTIGAWLYFELVVEVELEFAALLLRGFILGTILGWAAWAGGVFVTQQILVRMGHPVDRWRLARVLGFAMLPMAVTLLMWLPDFVQGDDEPFGSLLQGLFIAVAVILPLFAWHAVRAVAAAATERQVTISVLGGYLFYLAVMGLLATWSGLAPVISLFTHGFEEYVDFGDFS